MRKRTAGPAGPAQPQAKKQRQGQQYRRVLAGDVTDAVNRPDHPGVRRCLDLFKQSERQKLDCGR